MNSASFKTVLDATVVITPSQLNNDLYMNIKDNLEKRLIGKCYKNYGLIEKIYNIQKISDGKINQEDNDCNVYYNVSFHCRILKPVINSTIIAKVNSINNDYIFLTSSNIKIIVTNKKIGNNYINDTINNTYKNKETNKVIENGDFMKVNVLKYQLMDKEKNIYVEGSLVDEATDEEVDKFYNQLYTDIKEDDDYDDQTEINDIL